MEIASPGNDRWCTDYDIGCRNTSPAICFQRNRDENWIEVTWGEVSSEPADGRAWRD